MEPKTVPERNKSYFWALAFYSCLWHLDICTTDCFFILYPPPFLNAHILFLLGATEETGEDGGRSENLTTVMESMGIYDTDLRTCGNTNTTAVHETQRLLKILLSTLNKAVAQGSISVKSKHSGRSTRAETAVPASDFSKQMEPASQTNYTEVRCELLILTFITLQHSVV